MKDCVGPTIGRGGWSYVVMAWLFDFDIHCYSPLVPELPLRVREILTRPSLLGRMREGLAVADGRGDAPQMAAVSWWEGVSPRQPRKLPGRDAWTNDLEDFLIGRSSSSRLLYLTVFDNVAGGFCSLWRTWWTRGAGFRLCRPRWCDHIVAGSSLSGSSPPRCVRRPT